MQINLNQWNNEIKDESLGANTALYIAKYTYSQLVRKLTLVKRKSHLRRWLSTFASLIAYV